MHMLEQHQGKDHVSAQDQADENMADSGDGVYLAKYKGEYMEVSMESANQLTVSAGALWVNGRFCIVDPAETLTVDNGSSGMTEYDLVCVHWKETTATQQVALAEGGTKEVSTTVEETELVIVKGDPASSGATDPEISQTTIRAGVGEAWVPFARITKDGLTPSVAFIVDRLVPESDFRHSISLYTTTKENVSIPTGSAPYTQLIFNFDGIGNKTIVGVTEIWSSRPSVVRIAQFNPLNNNQLEVWIGNAVSSASSANVRVTVAAMQL